MEQLIVLVPGKLIVLVPDDLNVLVPEVQPDVAGFCRMMALISISVLIGALTVNVPPCASRPLGSNGISPF